LHHLYTTIIVSVLFKGSCPEDYTEPLNPIILIIVGLVLIFASRLAKFVGAVCTVLGVILLLLPFLLTMI